MKRNSNNNGNKSNNNTNAKKKETNRKGRCVEREEPRKDSSSKRVNYDNARESRIEKDMKKDNANDVSWYSKSSELMKSAGSIPFSTILGLNTDIEIPGVMAIPWAPAFGTDNVALNQSFNSMYSFMVHANSRNYNYNSPDLGVLFLAGANCFTLLAAICRAYGTAKAYTEENMFYPDVLLTAQGFNPDDVRSNLPDMWYSINNFIDQLKQVWIPNTLPVLDRWVWMNSEMFTDAEGFRSQVYLYVQSQYLIYAPTTFKTGGAVLPVSVTGEPDTTSLFTPGEATYNWATWKTVMQALIDALIQSEDRGIIFGDILNAYGASSIRAWAPISSDFTVVPRYNAEALMQIENTFSTPVQPMGVVQIQSGSAPKLAAVWPTTFNNKYGGGAPNTASFLSDNVILNFHSPGQPSPEVVTVMTRNINMGMEVPTGVTYSKSGTTWTLNASAKVLRPKAIGSEAFGLIRIYAVNSAAGAGTRYFQEILRQYYPNILSGGAEDEFDSTAIRSLMALSSFDWHPPVVLGMPSGTLSDGVITFPTTPKIQGEFIDFDNYSEVNYLVIKRLHDMALFSLFGVPQI